MYRLNPDCWIRSLGSPLRLLSQHSETDASGMLVHEEMEEEAGEHHSVCCYAAGCNDISGQGGDTPRSPSEPPIVSGNPSNSSLAWRGLAVPPSQQPAGDEADRANATRHFTGGCCWEGPEIETQACACVYGQRDPVGGGQCWPGSPYIYYGVRRNVVVEVVEEVAVEDTVEVLTEDICATDDLLDPELQQNYLLYPT
ncbi:hypothetical protein Q5P01_011726 [Channa striata]|uniref:Uncharacterized protein n=1 Tax=Channa striata TaxID=64152 RepID=A0AA88SR16_CHASR|nr:hypothetical protein Q5P01_011726 [Channa striata]